MNNGLQHLRPRVRSESDALAIPTTGSVEFDHGLRRVPSVDVNLVCLTAEHSYSVGDEISIERTRNVATPAQPFLSATVTSGKVTVTRNAGNADVWKKDASAFGTITAASWAIKIRCS